VPPLRRAPAALRRWRSALGLPLVGCGSAATATRTEFREGALGPLRISAIMLALVITVTQGVVIRSILRDLGKAMITEDLVPRHHPARLT
jgi:hypothetical protein